MTNSTFAKLAARARLRPWHLALCVLFVGWVPALLVAYLSHTVVSRALEEKITGDAQTLVDSLSKYIDDNVVRTGETMDYYRTLPATAAVLQNAIAQAAATPSPSPSLSASSPSPSPRGSKPQVHSLPPLVRKESANASPAPTAPSVPNAQEWLSGIYYSQTRVDGMFLTDVEGCLLAAVPPVSEETLGEDFASEHWLDGAAKPGESFYVSPVYARPSDGRAVTSTVVAVRDRADKLLGFLGADTLVERMGRRLDTIDIARRRHATPQIIDQNGFPLFTDTLSASSLGRAPAPSELRAAARRGRTGSRQIGATLYTFSPIGKTGWTAVLEESATLAQGSVRDLRRQTFLLVGLLITGSTLAAWLVSFLYRRQLNAALAVEREQIFNEKILANMAIGIALIEPNSDRLLQANASFFSIVRTLGTLPAGLPITRARFGSLGVADVKALHRVLRTGMPFQATEQAVETRDGSTLFLTTELLRLQDSQARTLGVLCLLEDRTADVSMRQELIDANMAKDQFFAQLSHELRTPLSPVVTMVAELERLTGANGDGQHKDGQVTVEDDDEGDTPTQARRALEVIRRNVELEARLIDDLLDITRIRSGKLQLNLQPVDVHRVIELAVEITRQEIAEKGLRLELRLEAARHHALADPARLQQVFWNLIKNSVKFTPAGRQITIRTEDVSAPAPAPDPAEGNGASEPPERIERVGIEVSDEGIGIAPELLGRIFNAFDQGQTAITRKFGGLGLGLAISRAMVEAHGGTLAASSPGTDQGATFRVELDAVNVPAGLLSASANGSTSAGHETKVFVPAQPEILNPVPPAAAASSSPAAGATAPTSSADTTLPATPSAPAVAPRVLLVDDHIDTCTGMKLLLRRRGYDVTLAHTVAEALARAEEASFDLLISDLGLPDATGFDLMRQLRERGGPPGIALSGFGMESDLEKSAQAGFSEHLIKPVNFARLDAAMRQLLAAKPAAAAPDADGAATPSL